MTNLSIKPKPKKFQDLTGQCFGRWTVIQYSYKNNNNKHHFWLCECICGNKKNIWSGSLKNGDSKSCGCQNIERITKHKMSRSVEYKTWNDMIQRCTNPNKKEFKNYGGRGIKVSNRWLESFENFYTDMGKKPDDLSLDRINNNDGYYKENCKWSTRSEQNKNKRYTKK